MRIRIRIRFRIRLRTTGRYRNYRSKRAYTNCNTLDRGNSSCDLRTNSRTAIVPIRNAADFDLRDRSNPGHHNCCTGLDLATHLDPARTARNSRARHGLDQTSSMMSICRLDGFEHSSRACYDRSIDHPTDRSCRALDRRLRADFEEL